MRVTELIHNILDYRWQILSRLLDPVDYWKVRYEDAKEEVRSLKSSTNNTVHQNGSLGSKDAPFVIDIEEELDSTIELDQLSDKVHQLYRQKLLNYDYGCFID